MESRAIVLAGAAALGAYEAGVIEHVVTAVARDVGRRQLFDIVSGTSAGAINASALAAFADDPTGGARRISDGWTNLVLGRTVRPSAIELLLLALDLPGAPSRLARALRIRRASGGLLDPTPISDLLAHLIPIDRLAEHLRAGLLRAIALSATHVATGRATVFYEAGPDVPSWTSGDETPVRTPLRLEHAMASAAIPLVFPPVAVDGELYVDGGLRQLVPLSPSLRLGARRLLVVNPLAKQAADPLANAAASTSPLYLAGKALNALFLDRTEVDVARVDQLSAVLHAGRARYGERFDAELNAELATMGQAPIHEVRVVRVGPSRDLGQLASEIVTSADFARRERSMVAFAMRCLAEGGPTRTGDLLSYLLFDGVFAAELIALGRADARAQHDELCGLLA